MFREGKLSPHAWLLHTSGDDKLWCGSNVETRNDCFFEGAWSGPFEDFAFSKCADVFGTGAARDADGWLLVPPSHTLEAIYALQTDDGWVASNSIAFVKQHTGFEFLELDIKLTQSFIGIVRGIGYSPAGIKTSRGEFYVLYHHNALLGRDGLSVRPKPLPPNFPDYAAYRDYLRGTVQAVAANAAATGRRATFAPLTTVSSGYDSPACAALAQTVGCKEAITFANARGGDSDDGTEIGEQLGMRVTRIQRTEIGGEFRDCTADLFATGMQAVDLVFEAFHGKVTQKLLLTGFHGDKIWANFGKAKSDLVRGDISGSSLGELRLSEAFIHMPVPFIGARRHADIQKITNSEEMRPYAIGGWYDRPVPRRLAEEAGVRRGAFGQSKKAVVILAFMNRALLRDDIREEIERPRRDFSFLQLLSYRARSARFAAEGFLQNFVLFTADLLPVGSGTYRKVMSSVLLFGRPLAFFEHAHPFNSLAFAWALSVVSKRYELAVGRHKPVPTAQTAARDVDADRVTQPS